MSSSMSVAKLAQSFFQSFGFPEVGAISMSDSSRQLFVPPLAGLEGQGCGSLGGGSSPAGVSYSLCQGSSTPRRGAYMLSYDNIYVLRVFLASLQFRANSLFCIPLCIGGIRKRVSFFYLFCPLLFFFSNSALLSKFYSLSTALAPQCLAT